MLQKKHCSSALLKKRNSQVDGFTLIEMLVVVAIIGILASIAVPSYSRYVDRARCQEVVGPVHSVMVGVVGDFAENGTAALGGDGKVVQYAKKLTINGVEQGFPDNVEIEVSRVTNLYTVKGKYKRNGVDVTCGEGTTSEGDEYVLGENESKGSWK